MHASSVKYPISFFNYWGLFFLSIALLQEGSHANEHSLTPEWLKTMQEKYPPLLKGAHLAEQTTHINRQKHKQKFTYALPFLLSLTAGLFCLYWNFRSIKNYTKNLDKFEKGLHLTVILFIYFIIFSISLIFYEEAPSIEITLFNDAYAAYKALKAEEAGGALKKYEKGLSLLFFAEQHETIRKDEDVVDNLRMIFLDVRTYMMLYLKEQFDQEKLKYFGDTYCYPYPE